MAGIGGLSGGIGNILKANSNLSDFKLTSDGGVKERSGFGKFFTAIKDHFANKTTAGRAMVQQRNAAVGRAMLNSLGARVADKMSQIDARAIKKGLALDSQAVTSQKDRLTRMVGDMRTKIGNLAQSSQKSFIALTTLRDIGETPEAKAGFMKVYEGKFDTKMAMGRAHSSLINLAQTDSIGNITDQFEKDVHRLTVKEFGGTAYTGDAQLDDLHDYLDDISHGSADVKKFLMGTMHQGGGINAISMIVNNFDNGAKMDESLPQFDDFVIGRIMPQYKNTAAKISTDDAGNINIRVTVNVNYGSMDANSEDMQELIFSNKVSLDIHVPVDANGNFTMEDGVPKFEVRSFDVTPNR